MRPGSGVGDDPDGSAAAGGAGDDNNTKRDDDSEDDEHTSEMLHHCRLHGGMAPSPPPPAIFARVRAHAPPPGSVGDVADAAKHRLRNRERERKKARKRRGGNGTATHPNADDEPEAGARDDDADNNDSDDDDDEGMDTKDRNAPKTDIDQSSACNSGDHLAAPTPPATSSMQRGVAAAGASPHAASAFGAHSMPIVAVLPATTGDAVFSVR